MTFQLRPYQQEAVDDLVRYFTTHAGNPLVSMPTGSGKSLVIAAFCEYALAWGSRVWVATHVKELVEQDHDKLVRLLGPELVGINSASVGRRDAHQPVLCVQAQSVFRRVDRMPPPDLLIVDESHLVPFEGRGIYRTLIDGLRARNPRLKVVGFTATPYRTRGGWLHAGDGRIFTHVAHSVDVVRLIDEGWLASLVAKAVGEAGAIETEGLRTRAGDFERKGLEAAAMVEDRLAAALDEVCARGADRRSWLVFACSVAHAEQVRQGLRRRGIRAELVTGTTDKASRERLVRDYRDGVVRALVNVNVLTTGFDAPQTDLLAVLRPTKSPVLYVQMMGRGMRIAEGKRDCLVLDYGRNVQRHGPVNAIRVPPGKAPDAPVEPAPVKTCPECGSLVHAALRQCPDCGHEWPAPEPQHAVRASDLDVVQRAELRALQVDHVDYARHAKPGKPASLRVTYLCGFRTVSEWICPEHGGPAAGKAARWWHARARASCSHQAPPQTVDEALARLDELRTPEAVWVRFGGRYERVEGEAALADVAGPPASTSSRA